MTHFLAMIKGGRCVLSVLSVERPNRVIQCRKCSAAAMGGLRGLGRILCNMGNKDLGCTCINGGIGVHI